MGKTVLTRQEIHSLLPELLAAAKKEKPFTLLLLKPVDFRLLQTELTPVACDKILQILQQEIQKSLPFQTRFGQWTGITFALLLTGHGKSEAEDLAEAINRQISRNHLLETITKRKQTMLFAAVEAPPRSLAIGLQAEKSLAIEEGRFLPLMEKTSTQEAFLGDFLQSFLQANDSYLARQSLLSSELVHLFAHHLGLKPKEREELRTAATVVDIGMLLSSENILLLPRPISPSEYNTIKRHPRFGANLARNIGLDETIAQAILTHHERWDGLGYPLGLSGEDIPLFGRILGFCTTYASLLLPRPYRRAYSPTGAKEILLKQAGTVFDPHLAHILSLLPLDRDKYLTHEKSR